MVLKTIETKKSVTEFVNSISDESKKKDTKAIISLIKKITGKQPKLWGTIIGFGKYKYNRKNSKEELEWFNIGVAPRKANISIYLTCYLENEPLIKKLGKIKSGKGCLYINKLDDIDLNIFKKLIIKYKNHKWYS
jgi:hypothetical protein